MKKVLLIIAAMAMPLCIGAQTLDGIEEIAPFSEGLAAVKKDGQWGFINREGELVIDFRDDLVWQEQTSKTGDYRSIAYPKFQDGRCMIRTLLEEEEIYVYGFIDSRGNTIIAPEYLNLTSFDDGYALGILLTKTFRGKNRFQLNIYDYKFSEVFLDTRGDIMLLVSQRDNILMDRRRYEVPELRAKYLSNKAIAVQLAKRNWEIRKIDF